MICNAGDIVVVPFPFVDNAKVKPRPALVLSSKDFNEVHNHSIMAMITTSAVKWKTDILIDDIKLAGLPVKSFIRMKLFTLDNRLIKKTIGSLNSNTQNKVKEAISNNLLT